MQYRVSGVKAKHGLAFCQWGLDNLASLRLWDDEGDFPEEDKRDAFTCRAAQLRENIEYHEQTKMHGYRPDHVYIVGLNIEGPDDLMTDAIEKFELLGGDPL